jgi:hypothetical protein
MMVIDMSLKDISGGTHGRRGRGAITVLRYTVNVVVCVSPNDCGD